MDHNFKPTRAGEAFLAANPDARHQMKAVVGELRAALKILQREEATHRAEWQATYGEPFPESIEDWERWVARAGIPGVYLPAEKIASGKWTGADVLPFIEGYLKRLADAKPNAPIATITETPSGMPGATCNDRMLAIFTRDKRCIGWSAEVWAKQLNVARSTITSTPTWKAIQEERDRLRAEKKERKERL